MNSRLVSHLKSSQYNSPHGQVREMIYKLIPIDIEKEVDRI